MEPRCVWFGVPRFKLGHFLPQWVLSTSLQASQSQRYCESLPFSEQTVYLWAARCFKVTHILGREAWCQWWAYRTPPTELGLPSCFTLPQQQLHKSSLLAAELC